MYLTLLLRKLGHTSKKKYCPTKKSTPGHHMYSSYKRYIHLIINILPIFSSYGVQIYLNTN
jgi:hypothetical protein